MSRTEQNPKKDKTKLFVRILSFVLALLMIAGMAYYTIYLLTLSIGADDTAEYVNTSLLKENDDVMISVGLMYGSNITTGFQTTTDNGFRLGIQHLDGDRDFTEIWNLYTTMISCTADANLSKSYMTYSIAPYAGASTVGGYHIQIDCDMYNRSEVEELISRTQQDVWNLGLYIIPAYIYTGYALRIGDFSTWNDASTYLDYVRSVYPNEIISVVTPEDTAVSVIDPNSDTILFEYDCGGRSELGIQAFENDYGNTYTRTPAGNVYDGTFCYKRYNNGTVDGVSVINVVPLEAYIAGVLPHEIPNTWPLETLKAFAITVRSFTLTHLGKHAKYNFDLCNTSECQVYKGAGKVTERVFDAIYDTAGQVMTYKGDIVTAYYSSSVGGVTVSSKDAWGGSNDIPYLKAVDTPWENYMVHYNAFWKKEASPSELRKRLNEAGYTNLTGDIVDIEIIEFAENSSYIKIIEFTDEYGNTATIKNSDKIRTSLTPYVNSANFVVGKGSVEYTENIIHDYVENEEYDDIHNIEMGGNGDDEDYDKDYGYINLDSVYIQTGEDVEGFEFSENVTVLTSEGEITHKKPDIFVVTKENAAAFTGEDVTHSEEEEIDLAESSDDKEDYSVSVLSEKSTDEIVYKIAYAEDENNFIFVGKGWGHGVGMSQYGARDLADRGSTAEEILSAYFMDIEIIDYIEANGFN